MEQKISPASPKQKNTTSVYSLLPLFLIFLMIFSPSSYSEALTASQELKQISYFSIGLNGFAGGESDGEKYYREILGLNNAKALFIDIATDRKATSEARLYAACGLKSLSYNDMDQLFFDTKKNTVTVLKGDVLRRYLFLDVYSAVRKHGCE
ncbi:hypothetical protein U2T19_004890 [Salmonella enterica]|nr:hypothetical protein [Salmonella enterica]ECF8135441.1 hypothetical protein [Salmonella enterica]EGI1955515.1 hypothetical protein [Salmonella enterica]EMA3598542.1 hypothetical protein [Salmonella enterica]